MAKVKASFMRMEELTVISLFGVLGDLIFGFFGHQPFLWYPFIYYLLFTLNRAPDPKGNIVDAGHLFRFASLAVMAIVAAIVGTGIHTFMGTRP